MKTLKICYIMSVLFTFGAYSITIKTPSHYPSYYPEKPYKYVGAVQENDSIYLDNTEIDVATWLSYMSWTIEHQGESAVQKLLPDSTAIDPQIWRMIKKRSEFFNDHDFSIFTGLPIGYFDRTCDSCTNCDNYGYHSHCSLYNFPITGLSFKQVNLFCEWRTELFKEYNMSFRLPTEKEWKTFTLNNLSKKEKREGFKDSVDVKDCKSCPKYNYRQQQQLPNLHARSIFLKDGLVYDLFGNVSEMTTEKGIAKGGNYLLYAKQCHPDSIQRYTKPEKWLGFRCVRVVKK